MGYVVHIPYRGLGNGTKGLNKHPARRWVVERTGRWMNLFRVAENSLLPQSN
jgi:hypothetical protein